MGAASHTALSSGDLLGLAVAVAWRLAEWFCLPASFTLTKTPQAPQRTSTLHFLSRSRSLHPSYQRSRRKNSNESTLPTSLVVVGLFGLVDEPESA
jgi:hypothetical protein